MEETEEEEEENLIWNLKRETIPKRNLMLSRANILRYSAGLDALVAHEDQPASRRGFSLKKTSSSGRDCILSRRFHRPCFHVFTFSRVEFG